MTTTRATTTVTTAVITAAAVAATASAPYEPLSSTGGRPHRAAAARTEELYTLYGRTVGALCGALLRDSAEAEDAAQQTFLSAHRALLNGGRPREPAAWIAAIARNECRARIKTRMREPLPSEVFETRVSSASDPVAEALRRADLAELWAAIDALPPVQRDALLLREFGGLSYEELAAALAVSAPAVESLLFRARRRLRVQLRAAFAALTGASWLDGLARLISGGGAPAAAKVAALGVGAAAIGSGAVVVPQVFDNHHPAQPTPRVRHVQRVRTPIHAAPVVAVMTTPAVAAVPAVAPVHRERRDGRRASGGDDLPPLTTSSGRDGGGSDDSVVTTAPVTTVQVAPLLSATTDDHSGDGQDGGGSGSDGGGTSGGDGGIDGSGDGGH
jgi:RNA polymerase sigma-70 factor, ECF subfamily